MVRKFKLFLSAAVLAFLLCSCSGFASTESLMRPPRLTSEQKAINDALDQAVISQDYSLKYPKSGDYRSAFVFQDLDGDGEEEALAFYALSFNDYARVILLDRKDGAWVSANDLAGAGQDVEFIAFANITGTHSRDVVIGWSSQDSKDRELTIYTYTDGILKPQFENNSSSTYNAYLIDDLDGDGLQDVFLLTRNSGNTEKSSWIKLLSFDGFQVRTLSSLPLSDSISDFPGVIAGMHSIDSAERAIFVDELLYGGDLVTEVFTVEDHTLVPLISYDMGEDPPEAIPDGDGELLEPDYVKPTLYDRTRRSNTALDTAVPEPVCTDINGDQVIELPTCLLLPGYEDVDEENQLYLTIYNQIGTESLEMVFAAVINRQAGYLVSYPDEWIGTVSVVSVPENNEWRFISYNGSLDDVSGELARIRVVSQKDYQDKFLQNYTQFATRGMFTYYGYIPEASALQPDDPLAVTLEQLRTELFALL